MKILSISFSNLPSYTGSWSFDVTSPGLEKSGGFLVLEKNDSCGKIFIDVLSLCLFGQSYSQEVNNLIHKVPESSKDLPSAEVRFAMNNLVYKAKWFMRNIMGNVQVQRELKYDSNELIEANSDTLNSTISSIIGMNREGLKKNLFFSPQKFRGLLSGSAKEMSKILSSDFGRNELQDILFLTKEVAKRERIAADVSKRMIDSFQILPPEEEQKLNDEIASLRLRITSLKKGLRDNTDALTWLEQLDGWKEELQKLNKEENILKADIARFDIKRPVLEKSLKAQELTFDFNLLKALRMSVAEKKKSLEELKSKFSSSSERFKNSQLVFEDSERELRDAERGYNQKQASFQKALEIDTHLTNYQNQLISKKNEFDKETAHVRALSEELNTIKETYTADKNKQQMLLKKISDSGADDKLRDELSAYQSSLEIFDKINNDIEDNLKFQKLLQKELEKNRLEYQENGSLLTVLKKEEVLLQSDIALKDRHITKALGKTSEEALHSDLDVLESKLSAMENLTEQIEKIGSLYEALTSEKDILNKHNYEVKLALIAFNSASQTYKDKKTIVGDAEAILAFQNKIKELEDKRKELENGKPCPLCGAIHHPYVSSVPLVYNGEEKLKEAQADERKAAELLTDAENKLNNLKESIEQSETIIDDLTKSIATLTGDVLNSASAIGISGLKEKKPISWPQIIRQRKTFVANKRDDLKNRIDLIDSYKSSGAESVLKLEKLRGQVSQLSDQLEHQKQNLTNIGVQLQNCGQTEVHLNLKKEELFKDYERFYLRYGIKVASIASLKQQISILGKRRETFIESTTALQEVENSLNDALFKIQEYQENITRLKGYLSNLESEINRCDVEEKRLLKEKSDILGNQSLQEYEETALKKFNQAKKAFEQAQTLFRQKETEYQSESQLISQAEEQLRELTSELDKSNSNFEKKLHLTGFTSEAQFTASKISPQQKEDLQNQSDRLASRSYDMQMRREALEEKITSLSERNLTNLPPAKIRENIEQQNNELHAATLREAELSEKIEGNHYNKQRLERESREQRKRENESLKWDDFVTLLKAPTTLADTNFINSVALDILVEYASKQLNSLNPNYHLATGKSSELGLRLVSSDSDKAIKTTAQMTSDEKEQVCLALTLGNSQIQQQLNKLNLIFIDELEGQSEFKHQWLTPVVARLAQQEKIVGVISDNEADRELFQNVIEFDKYSIQQIKGTGIFKNMV